MANFDKNIDFRRGFCIRQCGKFAPLLNFHVRQKVHESPAMHAHRYKSACILTVTLAFNQRSPTVSSIRRAIWRETITLSLGSLNCRIIELQCNIRWFFGARYSLLVSGYFFFFFFIIKRSRAAFETRGPTRLGKPGACALRSRVARTDRHWAGAPVAGGPPGRLHASLTGPTRTINSVWRVQRRRISVARIMPLPAKLYRTCLAPN